MTLNDSRTDVSKGSSWKKWLEIAITAAFVVAFCVTIRYIGGGPERAAATSPQKTQSPQTALRTASNSQRDSSPSPDSAPAARAKTAPAKTGAQDSAGDRGRRERL